jgi:phage shock protein E
MEGMSSMQNPNRFRQLMYVLLVIVAAWSISQTLAGGGDREAAKQAWPMIENGALLVDVRSQEEFEAEHLEGAVNIPWDNTDALMAAIGTDKQRAVVFYCRSGNRAGKSIDKLGEEGYTNIFNATGLEALKETAP